MDHLKMYVLLTMETCSIFRIKSDSFLDDDKPLVLKNGASYTNL